MERFAAIPKPEKRPKPPPGPLRRTPFGEAKRAAYQAEKAFQNQVEELAGYLGWYAWHINLPQRSKAGFPDCLLLRERAVWIELKVHRKGGRGKVMPEQQAFHEMLRLAGQEVYVFFNDDDDWQRLQEVLLPRRDRKSGFGEDGNERIKVAIDQAITTWAAEIAEGDHEWP